MLKVFRWLWRWLTHDVKRRRRWWWQRRTRGWDDRELWSLDWRIAQFVLPRLRAFATANKPTPFELTPEEWRRKLDDMAYAFEVHAQEPPVFEADWDRARKGMKAFAKYYGALWI